MKMIADIDAYFCLVNPSQANLIVKSKFRGIDPWILSRGIIIRITSMDPLLAEEYKKTKEKIERGWAIKLK